MGQEYNFKKFTQTGSKLGNFSISYNASHSFGFNSGFYNRERIFEYKKVVLFYDPEKKAVAFKFVNENEEGAFTIIHGKGSGSVSAHSFVTANDLAKKEYFGKKIPHKIKDEQFQELWIIRLLDNNIKSE